MTGMDAFIRRIPIGYYMPNLKKKKFLIPLNFKIIKILNNYV